MKLKKLICSKLFGNIISLGFIQGAGALIPLLAWPYLARVLGSETFGLVILFSAVALYLSSFVEYGFNYTSTREISQSFQDKDKVKKIFVETILSRIILYLVGFLFVSTLIFFLPAFYDYKVLAFLSLMLPLSLSLSTSFYFQGVQKLKRFAVCSILEKSIAVAMIYVFVKVEEDYLKVPIIYAAANAIFSLYFLTLVNSSLCAGKATWSFKGALERIASGFSVFVNVFAPNFYSNFSLIILGSLHGPYLVFLLDGYRKISSVFDHVLNAAAKGFFPAVNKKIGLHYYAKIVLISVGAFAFFLLSFFSSDFVELISGEAVGEFYFLGAIVGLGVLGLSMKLCYSVNYLLVLKRDAEVRNISLIASFFAFLVALLLIPHFSIWGAAISIMFGRLGQGVMAFYLYSKVKKYD